MILDGSTGGNTRELVQQHKVQRAQFDMTKSCDDSLNQKILAAFHNDYVEGLVN